MMNEHVWNIRSRFQGWTRTGFLLLGCFGPCVAQPSWGQAPIPPSSSNPAAQKENTPLPDPFYEALEGLSKKYGVAFVAEGRPFPTAKSGILSVQRKSHESDAAPMPVEDQALKEEAASPADPAPNKILSSEEAEVQKVAARFDYDFLHQSNVYLLQKRYTNPDDLPEVTPEECRRWMAIDNYSSGRYSLHDGRPEINSVEKRIAGYVNATLLQLTKSRHRVTQEEFIYRVIYGFGADSPIMWQAVNRDFPMAAIPQFVLTADFFFQSFRDRVRATRSLLDNSRPLDAVFYWQTIGQSPVFGYDTQFNPQANLLFIPVSDCDRIGVVPYGTPQPRSDFWMRTETQLPDPDPTDPKSLSPETKRFLDDNGRSSRAVTLAEAIAPINKVVPKRPGYKIYQVDPTFAAKRVTLVGTEKLSPETLMQSLATVYGLNVDHRRDDHVVLTFLPDKSSKRPELPRFMEYDEVICMPDPIYRVIHARFLAGRTKAKNQEGQELLAFETQYEFQRIGATFRNAAMRMLRYLAEPQVKAQPNKKLPLSRLGEREYTLFMFAQTMSASAAACELMDIPPPPYITHRYDFAESVNITGGVYRKGGSPKGPYIYDPIYFSKMTFRQLGKAIFDFSCPDDTARLALFLTYVDPKSGVGYGPVQFLDLSLYLPDLQ